MPGDILEYLTALETSVKFRQQVVCHHTYRKRKAKYTASGTGLSETLVDMLTKAGIDKLYTHQHQAVTAVKSGRDIIVATPTASGKSMVYNLPVLDDFCRENTGHSLYLFPLKALAQDQLQTFNSLFDSLPGKVTEKHDFPSAIFDGDTSSYQRRKIRERPPAVLFTNPEMVHLSLLAYHSSWQRFLENLSYVVIDEVHCYRGILGSHMSWVIRRLIRIAAHYGSYPRFILLSATIGNPEQLGRQLLGRPVTPITESGGPQAEKHMVFLNPWDSAPYTASQLLEAAMKRNLRTIVYTQSRRMTELISLWTQPRLGSLAGKLSAYRAGFLPEERREIEAQLFSGELIGVISTSALELGIDIGELDLCILVGYPGSIMATMQRGGRVGRSQKPSAVVLIANEDALDQHFMRNHEDFFRREAEAAVLNPVNSTIMEQHLMCCAAELPVEADEPLLTEPMVEQAVGTLAKSGALLETAGGGCWITARKYPQRFVSLRGGGRQMSIIDQDSGEIIGEIDASRAMKECHPGAVYLHRGVTWNVCRYRPDSSEILVKRDNPHYFTRPLSQKRTEILELFDRKTSFGVNVSFGKVLVRERVTGYQKKHSTTHKLLDVVSLDLPEQVIETRAVWVDIDRDIVDQAVSAQHHFMGGIHAMEHGMIALFPLLVLCDRNDVGGISCPLHEQTEMASVFIYDGYPGGVGLAEEAFLKIDELLTRTYTSIAACPCDNGCPSCVHSPKCGSGNRPIDKKSCLFLLEKILGTEPKAAPACQGVAVARPASAGIAAKDRDDAQLKGVDALPARFVVYDLETIRSAEEVGGWNRCSSMGVSMAVVYDSHLGQFVSYTEPEMDRLVEHLQAASLIVGFNNKRFDNLVLSAYTDVNLHDLPSLDLLEEVHAYLGYRLSLDKLGENTLGVKKSADGLQALKWYKEGRLDLIQQYCRKDVEITRDLLLFCLERGHLLFKNKAGHKVRLPLPLDLKIGELLRQDKNT